MKKRSRTLRYKLLMAAALTVVIAWSVLWFLAATIVDRHAQKAEHLALTAGAIADCVNRSVSGFPFRVEVRCDNGSRLGTIDAKVQLDGLTVAALIYRPSRVILEAQGPALISANGMPEVTANWDLAHASVRLDVSERALERLDVELVEGTLSAANLAPVSFGELDVNVRVNPQDPDALDMAVRAEAVRPQPGAEASNFSIRGSLSDGAGLLSGRPEALLAAFFAGEAKFMIDSATFQSGPMQMAAAGTLKMGPDGLLDGDIDLAIAGYHDHVPYVAVVSPQAEATISTLLGNVLAFAPTTTIGNREAKKLSLKIKKGQIWAGALPLAKIPPIVK